MSADLSRVRFDPLLDYSSVVLQQGRLLLDGDFNELAAIVDRRFRAETVDLTSFGPDPDRAGSSWVPRQTPDAFALTAAAGTLSIGRGRMYVDGLLVENHGRLPTAFDPLLAEQDGTAPVSYLDQPWWPVPDDLPEGPGPHLVYLDVWQREVTHVTEPRLVEVAVGVDTSARLQTVWQVRVLPDVGAGVTCATTDTDIPGWSARVAPSAGRLTVTTVPVDAEDDPCSLPPTGGFRGLENQSYRVQVHDGGAPGTATFTWSRENGSVVQPVVEVVDATTLRLASLGRDELLAIHDGDWVEVLDDNAELGGAPGELRQVTVADPQVPLITFSGALPPSLVPADADDAAARHLRVVRWDQSGGDVTPAGVVTVPASDATQVVLEHGIAVSFSVAEPGGAFRAGDHWTFAARTADTSVEALVAAPPLGTHHHYARLGVVTFPTTVADCRRLWPSVGTGDGAGCDCTVCVDVDSHTSGSMTIQAAIDQVKEEGGTVCLHAGTYDIGPGLDLDGARSVRLHGQGMATRLVARAEALRVNRSSGLLVDHLLVVSGVAADEVIRINSTTRSRFEDLAVLALGNADRRGAAIRLTGLALDLAFSGSLLLGGAGLTTGEPHPDDQPVPGVFGGVLRLRDNLVVGSSGIDLGEHSAFVASVVIEANDIWASRGVGVRANGALLPQASVTVTANTVWTDGTGIVVGGMATVRDNVVHALDPKVVEGNPSAGSEGIVVDQVLPGWQRQVEIAGNRIARRAGAAIALRCEVEQWSVHDNLVETAGAGIVIEGKGRITSGATPGMAAVDRNHLRDIGLFDLSAAGDFSGVVAIGIGQAEHASVTDNVIANVGVNSGVGPLRAAITATACRVVTISGNHVSNVGSGNGVGCGVLVTGRFDQATITGNAIEKATLEAANEAWVAIAVQTPFFAPDVTGAVMPPVSPSLGSLKGTVDVTKVQPVLTGGWARLVTRTGTEHVTLSDNATRSAGNLAGVVVRTRGDLVATGNQVFHASSVPEPAAVGLEARARSATLSSNRLHGKGASILLSGMNENAYAVLGNLTPGGIDFVTPGGGIDQRWVPFNPELPE